MTNVYVGSGTVLISDPTHFVRGEDVLAFDRVVRAPGWARRTEAGWPMPQEGWNTGYLCTWVHKDHVSCSCVRSVSRFHTITPDRGDPEGPARFPHHQAWWSGEDHYAVERGGVQGPIAHNHFLMTMRGWGRPRDLILKTIEPIYYNMEIEWSTWDESWGGGPTPWTPTSIADPWLPPRPSWWTQWWTDRFGAPEAHP
jgi:hypothetical protein